MAGSTFPVTWRHYLVNECKIIHETPHLQMTHIHTHTTHTWPFCFTWHSYVDHLLLQEQKLNIYLVLEWQMLFSLVYYTRYEVACKNRRLFLKLQAHIYPPKPIRLYKIILVQLFYSFFLSFCLFFDGLNFCLE